MLIGEASGERDARSATHASSFQTWVDCVTTDAVAGGTSVPNAIGSAFSTQLPSGPWMRNLYASPCPTPGTKRSQTPDPIGRMTCWSPPQKLNSPATCTDCAFGAHTVNEVPSVGPSGPSYVRGRAPSTSHSRSWRPSLIRWRSSSPIAAGHAGAEVISCLRS